MTDGAYRCVRHAHVDELLEPAAGGDNAKGAVLGLDQFDGDLDDGAKDGGQIQLLGYGLGGSQ